MKTIEELKARGFNGFVDIDQLMLNQCEDISNTKGIYLDLRESQSDPEFLNEFKALPFANLIN